MTPSASRIVVACLWVASLGGAYYLGHKGSEPGRPISTPAGNAAGTQPTTTGSAGAEDEGRRAPAGDAKGERLAVKDAILQARAAFGSGTSPFMNMRGMLRAMAPLLELSDAEIQEALAEVDLTVKEPQQKMMFYSLLLSQWAETDGPAALAYAKDKIQGQGPMMSSITMSVVGTWARRDPEGTWRWYLDAREKGERSPMGGTEGYLPGIFSGMAAANVDAAIGRLGTLSEFERQQAISGIAMTGMDPLKRDSLLSRASSLDAPTRATLYQGIVGMWMMSDAEGATKWIGTLPAEERKPLVATAGSTLMFMNPEKGAELQLQNASEKELPQTYSRVISQWANRDPQAAGDWLNKQPQGPELDEARRNFAVAISTRDPAGAYDWAKTMQDEKKRMDAYRQVYGMMESKNPANATSALEQAGLPPETVAQIRESVAKKKAESTKQ